MSSCNTTLSEFTPKCRCGAGPMKLYTSRTQLNPNRKFWKCPNWKDENGCGAFLWNDEVAHFHLAEANSMTCERDNLIVFEQRVVSRTGGKRGKWWQNGARYSEVLAVASPGSL
ncbi:hypothetical protein AAC387_Pa07g2843 [Persea americana]